MRQEGIERVAVASQFFHVWNQTVNGFVAVAANVDRLVQLFASETLLEPLIAVAGPWNQMMLGGAAFDNTPAELTPQTAHGATLIAPAVA